MLVQFERHPFISPFFDPAFDFGRDIEELFGNFLRVPAGHREGSPLALDVMENAKEIVVVAELPGVKKEDLKISLEDGILSVSGERKQAALPENSKKVSAEIPVGTFRRTIELPSRVKDVDVTAELSNGLLRVVLPKAEDAIPRQIAIR